MSETEAERPAGGAASAVTGLVWRAAAWGAVAWTFAFLLNTYLSNWRDWPGALAVFDGGGGRAAVQALVHAGAIAAAAAWVLARRDRPMRRDALAIYALSAYVVRAAFWVVLLVGMVDLVISFLRIEGYLERFVGAALTRDLGRANFRGHYVHLPLIALSLVVAAFARGLGFIWLALLVVVAELLIVITRFIFSYEQAFMGDLVRFWYAALFLFASAHTLIEEGHVRVDILYAGLPERRKGMINAVGSIVLGMALSVLILVIGMESKSSIINSPLLSFEVSQSGFGLYVKYLMAAFLAVYAVSMMLQFAGYMLEGAADWRGEPGKRAVTPGDIH